MSRRSFALVAGLALLLPPAGAVSAAPDTAAAGTAVSLPFGRDIEVDAGGARLRLRLSDVHDSRCPARVTCVWAGIGAVTVHVTLLRADKSAAAPVDVALSIPGDPQAAFGAILTLDSLDPRPATDGGPGLADYVAGVRVLPPTP